MLDTIIKVSAILAQPVFFLIILVVLLKLVRSANSHSSLLMYYGKQIELIRKIVGSDYKRAKETGISENEKGIYEILMEERGDMPQPQKRGGDQEPKQPSS